MRAQGGGEGKGGPGGKRGGCVGKNDESTDVDLSLVYSVRF
jgi:hypothetical protein